MSGASTSLAFPKGFPAAFPSAFADEASLSREGYHRVNPPDKLAFNYGNLAMPLLAERQRAGSAELLTDSGSATSVLHYFCELQLTDAKPTSGTFCVLVSTFSQVIGQRPGGQAHWWEPSAIYAYVFGVSRDGKILRPYANSFRRVLNSSWWSKVELLEMSTVASLPPPARSKMHTFTGGVLSGRSPLPDSDDLVSAMDVVQILVTIMIDRQLGGAIAKSGALRKLLSLKEWFSVRFGVAMAETAAWGWIRKKLEAPDSWASSYDVKRDVALERVGALAWAQASR